MRRPVQLANGGSSVDLEISVRHDDHGTRIRCAGPMDLVARGVLPRHVADAVRDEKTTGVVLDLSEVSWMDSAGLHDLVESVLLCEKRAVAWRIAPSMVVERMWRMVGLGRMRSDQSGGWLSGGGYGDE